MLGETCLVLPEVIYTVSTAYFRTIDMPIIRHTSAPHLYSSELSCVQGISHGFSMVANGDMRQQSNQGKFAQMILGRPDVYTVKQVHGNRIIINPTDADMGIKADGIFLNDPRSVVRAIGVLSADCVPLLFANRQGTCIGAVHAGWKGTQTNIVGEMVRVIHESGVAMEDIRVAIGPHIGACCYVVPRSRIDLFALSASELSHVAYSLDEQWHLDIGKINMIQLEREGLLPSQIDAGVFCTSSQDDLFFSYRRDATNNFGEMMAVIGFTI